jgi:hypothetical protein
MCDRVKLHGQRVNHHITMFEPSDCPDDFINQSDINMLSLIIHLTILLKIFQEDSSTHKVWEIRGKQSKLTAEIYEKKLRHMLKSKLGINPTWVAQQPGKDVQTVYENPIHGTPDASLRNWLMVDD